MFEIKENISLKNYNTFGIDIKCQYFVQCFSDQDIIDFLKLHKKQELPLMILGGGSNVLFTKDFKGYIMQPSIKGIEKVDESDEFVNLRVGAGEDWDEFVEFCVNQGWGGIENLSLIPGNVGTCPIQNIGAYGVEVKDIIINVETINRESLELKNYNNSDCKFGYRDSIFKHDLKNKEIITHVYFKLKKQPKFKLDYGNLQEELKRFDTINLVTIRQAVIDIRDSKLPKPEELGNSGSFFKNPVVHKTKAKNLLNTYPDMPSYQQGKDLVKIPAGWLIEKSGWKGKRVGDAGVHEKQALVLVNYGGADGKEILDLAHDIQKSVKNLFDINIEMEVNVV